MKKIIIPFFLLLFFAHTINAQSNQSVINLLTNSSLESRKWAEKYIDSLSIDEKLTKLFIFDGRENTLQQNVEILKKVKPAGILLELNNLNEFAENVNLYRKLAGQDFLIAVDAGEQTGLPHKNALIYPGFVALGAIEPMSRLVKAGNDIADQLKIIGADLIYVNTRANKNHRLVQSKLNALQKGVWFKNKMMLFYNETSPILDWTYFSPNDIFNDSSLLKITNDISKLKKDLKDALDYKRVSRETFNNKLILSLQVLYRAKKNRQKHIYTNLLPKELNSRAFTYNRNDLEQAAVTLIRNPEQIIPIPQGDVVRTVSITLGSETETYFQKKLQRYNDIKKYNFSYHASKDELYKIEEEIEDVPLVIFEVIPQNNRQVVPAHWGFFIEKINHLCHVVVNVVGNPEILQQLNNSNAYDALMLSYENTENFAQTAAEIIYGEKPTIGRLPYTTDYPYIENDRKEIKEARRFVPVSTKLPPKRELRGAWIASVLNIDWPSKSGLSTEEQKAEFIKLLDMHKENGINAIFFQVSPSADAFYQSQYLPWSQWLNGRSGKAPDPYYDPLEFMVDETHKRNMEFHAWFNPYRVKTNLNYEMDSTHASNLYPHLMVSYGNRLYYDPGYDETRKIVVRAVGEAVKKYDIDGVHFDDYFYPYKISGVDFPDEKSFEQESRGFAPEQKDDWRRDNVNLIIKMLHDEIKSIKPWVKFGISPFGVWRNKINDPSGSETKAGVNNYDDLYADVLLWMENKWVDYMAPQVYWERGKAVADFTLIVDWWSKNTYSIPVYIGHGIYKTDKNSSVKAWQDVSEIPSQIKLVRSYPEIEGSIFYNTTAFVRNPMNINHILKEDLFKYPAFIPTMPLIDNTPPDAPEMLSSKRRKKGVVISWTTKEVENEMDKANYYAIYRFDGEEPVNTERIENIYSIQKKNILDIDNENKWFKKKKVTFVITAFDRLHNESESISITVKL